MHLVVPYCQIHHHKVGSEPYSHEGLGLPCYVQATSPIRRYGDLCVHRQLKALLRGDSALPFPQPPNESQPNADSDIVRIARDDNGAREVSVTQLSACGGGVMGCLMQDSLF